MNTRQILLLWAVLLVVMLACRCLPLVLLRGRSLSPRVERALSLIPVAAFAALVANDLFKPDMFADGVWPAAIPLIATVLVVFVGYKTKSLLWCIIVGVVAYGLMMLIG